MLQYYSIISLAYLNISCNNDSMVLLELTAITAIVVCFLITISFHPVTNIISVVVLVIEFVINFKNYFLDVL